MKAYIAISVRYRETLRKEMNCIKDTLSLFGISAFVFVDEYNFDGDERKMMALATKQIDESGLLIAEVSDKAIGVGIEAGYAKAKGKFVVYLRNFNAEHSTTVSGISDFQIIYRDAADLCSQLNGVMYKFLSGRH